MTLATHLATRTTKPTEEFGGFPHSDVIHDGAGDGIRTRSPLLGKQMRYHCATPAPIRDGLTLAAFGALVKRRISAVALIRRPAQRLRQALPEILHRRLHRGDRLAQRVG